MSPSAESNGANGAEAAVPYLSTLPGPNHEWKISLKDKVIASKHHYHH